MLAPLDKKSANQYSPLALAFLGDSVYEQLVREKLTLYANMPVGKLHSLAVKYVCCEFQSDAVESVLPLLDEDELDVVRRGRNAGGVSAPKHSSVIAYRRATGLEALFGYLHLLGKEDRIAFLFEKIWENVEISRE